MKKLILVMLFVMCMACIGTQGGATNATDKDFFSVKLKSGEKLILFKRSSGEKGVHGLLRKPNCEILTSKQMLKVTKHMAPGAWLTEKCDGYEVTFYCNIYHSEGYDKVTKKISSDGGKVSLAPYPYGAIKVRSFVDPEGEGKIYSPPKKLQYSM